MHNKPQQSAPIRRKAVARIDARVCDELYDLILEEARRLNISLGEVLGRAAADKFGRPELGPTEKEKPGPKPQRRSKQPA